MKSYNQEIDQINKQLDQLEDKTLVIALDKKGIKKIKQTSKVSLKEITPGIGNTTNLLNDGPKRCVGCGKELQIEDEKLPGFVLDIEKQDYCLRCFKIKHYNKLVEQEINDKDFIEILDNINKTTEKIRYYYVVDIFDLPGSRLEWLEQLIAQKEVVILVNKVDLLPKSVKKVKIFEYINRFFASSPIANSKIILTSSIKKNYVYALVNELVSIEYDQYIIGISNAGKSSLINACLQANNQIPSIVTSKYVNTTLDKIKINFTKKNYIYDTPGLVKHNHIATATAPTYWDFFFFQKEIKQVTFQLKERQSIFYGGLAWFTYESGVNLESKNQKTSFHFYVNKAMPLHRTKSENALNYFKNNRHNLAPRLLDQNIEFDTFTFNFENSEKTDIHISGLGWINFKSFDGLKLTITVPKTEYGIKVECLPALI